MNSHTTTTREASLTKKSHARRASAVRAAAGREEDGLRRDGLLRAVGESQLDLVRADDLAGTLKLLHAGVVEEAAVDAVEALNLIRLGGDETLPRERGHLLAVVPPEPDRVAELRLETRAVDEELELELETEATSWGSGAAAAR